ncbi:hypothetical protein Tco_0411061 [Tanacetum coccineum]
MRILVSFKNSDKSSSFIFFKRSPALDSSFEPDSVWAVFNPSLADLILSTKHWNLRPCIESLEADNPGSASAVEYAKASCPDDGLGIKSLPNWTEYQFSDWPVFGLDASVSDLYCVLKIVPSESTLASSAFA